MAVYYAKDSATDKESISYCFVPTDCHIYEKGEGDENHYEKKAYYSINTNSINSIEINKPGYTIFNHDYEYRAAYFPPTYTSAAKATEAITTRNLSRGMFSYDYGTINYLGIYFMVPGVFSIDDDNVDEGIYIYKNGMYTKDYVKEDKNFCIPHGYSLPTVSSGSYNLNNYDIVSIKDNITGKRTFYLYYENEILGNKLSEVDLSQFNSINFTYIGDVVSIPATGNTVTRKPFSNTDTIENILKQAFGDIITIYYRDTTYNSTDFFVNNYNNSIHMQAEEYSRVKGYASVTPYIIAIREYGKNLLPKFYIKPDVVLQKYADGAFNLLDKNLVSIKDTNGNRTFYVYHSKDDMIKKFEMSDLCNKSISYKGDVRQIPDNGNSVTHVDFEESDTVENILEQLFGENIIINRSNNAGQDGDINVTSSLNNSLSIATSGKAMYTESINNEFIFYNLLYTGDGAYGDYKICTPFLNEAEFKFAFGEREDLQYITEEEYQEIIGNNTGDISND